MVRLAPGCVDHTTRKPVELFPFFEISTAMVFSQYPSKSGIADPVGLRERPIRALSGAEWRTDALTASDRALVSLGQYLRASGYRFTTVTPVTHRRVIARQTGAQPRLEDVFGWSRPFGRAGLPDKVLELLADADALEPCGTLLRSAVRFSTLGQQIFAHSAFPTEQVDAVFFGPDTYRFARAIRHSLQVWPRRQPMRIVDVGAGSGAGGLHAASVIADPAPAVVLTDINRRALRFCRINAALNETEQVETIESDLFNDVRGKFDLIISNPPYLVDPLSRLYRHGGGALGSALSLKIIEQGIGRLAPGGRLLLYTGSAIVDGKDVFHEALQSRLAKRDLRFEYEEVDPDVFGEELDHPPYNHVDRIAVVTVTIDRVSGDQE
jgi:methylase of polypeptide subunit release factors